jgi:hypothetical protein
MTKKIVLTLLLIMLALPLSAQRVNLDFPGLSERADEVVDVTLDATLLRVAAKFLSNKDSEERAVREMVGKLEGIYVRSYTFREANSYDKAIVERVRTQLGPNWKRIVTVRSKDRENVEVYTDMRGEDVRGLVVISAEPRELTLVNIVGPIDLERLSDLRGLGVPRLDMERDRDREKERKP